jgi:hypothetical protein
MEDIIFQLYGTLVLTLLGFVLPIITIAISAFPEGVKLLKQRYENEQKQAEKNLEDELSKQKAANSVDYDLLSKNISTLKSAKKKAIKRLLYLSPDYILIRSIIGLGICLATFMLAILFLSSGYISTGLFLVSLLALGWAVGVFINSIEIIIEASAAVQDIRRATEEKTLELLTIIADNSKKGDSSLFIDPQTIKVMFDGQEVTDGKEFTYSVNNPHKIEIGIKNLSEYLFKTAELGFIFPSEVLVSGSTISNIYTGDKEKIVRFKWPHLQSNLNHRAGTLEMSFLKTGTFEIGAFAKGENLKNKLVKFKIRVVN